MSIHRLTSNYDLIDKPINGLATDCGTVLTLAQRVSVDRLILSQRLPSFASKEADDEACYFCSLLPSLSKTKGIWVSYWEEIKNVEA